MSLFRHQLPAYSPLELGPLTRATIRAIRDSGSAVDSLGQRLRERFAAQQAILVGSGTQALQLALEHVRRKRPGQPIAIPAYSCFDVITAVVGARVPIRFYDIDPKTLAPDLESLRHAVGPGVGGVLVGNLCGYPLRWDAIRDACREHDAIIIEDAAQGIGATWDGKESGSFGDLTILSFGRGKGWTGGSGGALLTRGTPDVVVREASAPRRFPAAKESVALWTQWALGRPALYGIPAGMPWLHLGETRYRPPGGTSPMSGLAAATVSLHESDAFKEVERRREAARALWTELTEVGGLCLCDPVTGGESGFLRFPLLASSRATATAAVAAGGKYGLARGYPQSLPRLALRMGLPVCSTRPTTGADTIANRLITAPTHRFSSSQDRAKLVQLLKDLYAGPR